MDGAHKGRIGYYDDDSTDYDEEIDLGSVPNEVEVEGDSVAVVYFGDFYVAKGYYTIPKSYIREVTTNDLMRRREELYAVCGRFSQMRNRDLKLTQSEELDFLAELHYVDSILVDRMIQARYSNRSIGAKVFISHSSRDKAFATWIGTDLKAAGHTPWFDEWDIRVGESIPKRISEGIATADLVVLILSEDAVASRWVENEWQTKYWDEVRNGTIQVLPILYKDCPVPELLKTKKYADFRYNYNQGLEDLLVAIDSSSGFT